jgi:uncharacterized protein with GYD domain
LCWLKVYLLPLYLFRFLEECLTTIQRKETSKMKVLVIVSWEDQTELPEMAAKVAPVFANLPAGVKRISSYGVIGGREVYGIYDFEDPAAMTRYIAAVGAVGFETEVLPVIETGEGIKAVLEAAQSLKQG